MHFNLFLYDLAVEVVGFDVLIQRWSGAVLQKVCHKQKYWRNDVLISTVDSFHPNNSPPVCLRDPGNT